jgi:hypothetical protein
MKRRALIFDVPPGRELHYSKIHGEYLGTRWAPLFHAYGYYLPITNVPFGERSQVHDVLERNSKFVALETFLVHPTLLYLAFKDLNPVLFGLIGGVVWAEVESYFAYWDGHVTFGSSHVTAHLAGYGLTKILMKRFKGFSWWMILYIAYCLFIVFTFARQWGHDGFAVTGEENNPDYPHRIDHLAHIGGLLAGAFTAWLTSGRRLV